VHTGGTIGVAVAALLTTLLALLMWTSTTEHIFWRIYEVSPART
jgi:hypothetical protein